MLVAGAALGVMAGCAAAPDAGVVVSRRYEPPEWARLVCTSWTPAGTCKEWAAGQSPERWLLELRGEGGVEGALRVPRAVWDVCGRGESFPKCGVPKI
ncbi:hypothetical protein [Nonomuraea salmonea]